MKKSLLKCFCSAALIGIAGLFSSCFGVNNAAQNGYVEITVKRSYDAADGYQTYRFEIPPLDSDKIYAGKTTADDNPNVEQYIIRAQSNYDVPFNAVEIHVIPEKKTEGQNYSAKAVIRLAEYAKTYDNQTTGFFWTINQDTHGLSPANYHVPMAEGGIFTLDFQTDKDHGVYEKGYNNNTSNYPLLSVKVAAPVKKW
jgi:hypothetical protein